jgi:hypothetical protein
MKGEQKIWFEKLTADRKIIAENLEKPSVRGIKDNVVEKYSDEAHFVYELLQNANDALATSTFFQLTKKGLYFKHNGKIHFSVSNPLTEDQDTKQKKLGHLNSITSIANSNKKESSIGKFGIGFKAVFQYTETPHIYDPIFQFKIERFIVPVLLENDLRERKKEQTIFYFPFNKKEKLPEDAYSEIEKKLRSLIYPTLFLNNIQVIQWISEKENGYYTKNCKEKMMSDDITVEMIELTNSQGENNKIENIILFSRYFEVFSQTLCIGYMINENGKLMRKTLPAFCYFPTRESTNLNFILHAPFLLNDSRESIQRFKKHNQDMVELLAQLSADSLNILKERKLLDDSIFEIIPYVEPEDDDFFAPFFDAIKLKLQTGKLLPSINGYFAKRKDAYWADSPELANLFSNEQLAFLVKNSLAKWVFTSIGRSKDRHITEYIDGGSERRWERREPNLIKSNMDFENKIAELINAEFINKQSDEWLHLFYEYLSERKSYQERFKTKPIFKDKDGNAVPAFQKIGDQLHSILFLPIKETISSCKTIHSAFLENKKTKDFIEMFGIKKPSLKDEIYNNILPLYENDGFYTDNNHMEILYNYWEREGRPEDFIFMLKDKMFIAYRSLNHPQICLGRGCDIYLPSLELEMYFKTKPSTRFVDIRCYDKFLRNDKIRNGFKDFMLRCGVADFPRINKIPIADDKLKQVLNLNLGTRQSVTLDKIIDGCEELIECIDKDRSILLWNYLTRFSWDNLSEGEHRYFYYTTQVQKFESSALTRLKNSKWIISNNNEFVSPSDISIDQIASFYQSNPKLEKSLFFKPSTFQSDKERIAGLFKNEEEAIRAKKLLEDHENKVNVKAKSAEYNERNLIDNEEEKSLVKQSRIHRTIRDLEELCNEFTFKKRSANDKIGKNSSNSKISFDEEVDFTKGIQELKKQLEIKKQKFELAEVINNSRKYSHDWFKAYLKLIKTNRISIDDGLQKTILFKEIKRIEGNNKYFLLCASNGYLSPEIENAANYNISLVFAKGTRVNIPVESVSKKGQDLLAYCSHDTPESIISRFEDVFRVEIKFTPTIELLDKLFHAFDNVNNIVAWHDIQIAMPPMNYIYGPPGTGKTTKICRIIDEILSSTPCVKFLILTPTNKASDVVCKILYDMNENIKTVRLSSPTDPEIKQNEVYRNTLNIQDLQAVDVVASTIHRLSYYSIQDFGLLFQYKWDYVIFDESSMIGLHYMTFAIMALQKTNINARFIIAGDPKQIPPVMEIDEKELEAIDFQEENIYSMMNLESFNPEEQSIRKIDSIENLYIQHRSIPMIGQLFSELSYSALLLHKRDEKENGGKEIPDEFKNILSSNVTFIDIPLNKENLIFRINKLFYSSYQFYCAILVSEIIKYFDSVNKKEKWTIGVISPYKAQAIVLNKLIKSHDISDRTIVYSDTVHGFQGDECDIVFFVCNPNNYYYTGNKKALVSKEYIYNVAISRARDYLVIIHPFSAIRDNVYINGLANSYKRSFGNARIHDSNAIEKILFGKENYIENNSYVTGHDNVNVFVTSKWRYIIKSNDMAIDIQLND